MNPLEKKTLGSSGLEVTRLGLGCAAIGGLYGDIPDEQAVQVVHRTFELGLNLLDTAPLYGAGKSETRLGLALKDIPRDNYVLASKVGRVLEPVAGEDNDEGIFDNPPPFKPVFDFSYDGVMRSFEESLQRLGVVAQIAEVLEQPLGTVLARHFRAIKRLRERLGESPVDNGES